MAVDAKIAGARIDFYADARRLVTEAARGNRALRGVQNRVRAVQAQMAAGQSAIRGYISAFVGIGGVVAAFQGLRAISEAQADIVRFADATGSAIDEIAALRTRADLLGSEFDDLRPIMQATSSEVERANENFALLGLSLRELSGQDVVGRFNSLVAAVQRIGDINPARAFALIEPIVGEEDARRVVEYALAYRGLRADIDAAAEDAADFTDAQRRDLAELDVRIGILGSRIETAFARFTVDNFEALNRLLQTAETFLVGIVRNLDRVTQTVASAIIAFTFFRRTIRAFSVIFLLFEPILEIVTRIADNWGRLSDTSVVRIFEAVLSLVDQIAAGVEDFVIRILGLQNRPELIAERDRIRAEIAELEAIRAGSAARPRFVGVGLAALGDAGGGVTAEIERLESQLVTIEAQIAAMPEPVERATTSFIGYGESANDAAEAINNLAMTTDAANAAAEALRARTEANIAAINDSYGILARAVEASNASTERQSALEEARIQRRLAEVDGIRMRTAAVEEGIRVWERERDALGGIESAFENFLRDSERIGVQLGDVVTNSIQGMEDAFVQFAQTGKLSFRGLVDSIIGDLTRLVFRQGFSALFGGGGAEGGIGAAIANFFGGSFHQGGVVTGGGAYRGGLRTGDVPILAQVGEVVTPAGRVPRGVSVNIQNLGTPQQALSSRIDEDRLGNQVISIVEDDIVSGGRLSRYARV